MKIKDMTGREIILDKIPERIVSLCPSVTESICSLGFSGKVVGVTDYCNCPENILNKITRIGGPKNINTDIINKLNPDLVLFVKDENSKKDFYEIENKFSSFVFDVNSVTDSLLFLKLIGQIFSANTQINKIINKIKEKLKTTSKVYTKYRYLYLVWKTPYMAAAGDTYISSLLSYFGFQNILSSKKKYPVIDINKCLSDLDVVFLPDEPYNFDKRDRNQLSKEIPQKEILEVNGRMFSWFGLRILKSIDYINNIVNKLNSARL